MKPKIIQQGAEAIISLENNKILKNRIKKSYRIPELDEKLRKLRTRSESKTIERLSQIIPVPKIFETDEKEKTITMEFIDGEKLSDNLENLDWKKICKQIGETIAKLHDADIIHGDLTTSNMIYIEEKSKENLMNCSPANNFNINKNKPNKRTKLVYEANNPSEASTDSFKIYFIDFGLSFHSKKIEDKAVDLHLLKQAFEAKHFKIAEQAIKIIPENYNSPEVIKRLKIVESRGRYKEKF